MRKKASKNSKKQGLHPAVAHMASEVEGPGGAFLDSMTEAISGRRSLLQWVYGCGLEALGEAMRAEAEEIVGPKGRRLKERTHNHWGATRTELTLGGRRVVVKRPRVRKVGGGDVSLDTVKQFQDRDALPERVQEQILLGVSTRGYEGSLDEGPVDNDLRGASKSAASRNLIRRTKAKMDAYLARRLDDQKFLAIMLDGIHIAERAVIVALGVTSEGRKVPLGLWIGATENHEVCESLLNDILERGLQVPGAMLFVIDGGRGLRKALNQVFGNRAVVQRRQLNKLRNVRNHLPIGKQAYVQKQLQDAYASTSYKEAKAKIDSVARWLKLNGEGDAARSVLEGLEETITLLKLGIRGNLLRSLSTTNAIENMMGTIRRVSRGVKRWRDGDMIRRWVAMGIEAAESRFRRIRGYRQLSVLTEVLRHLDSKVEAA